MCILQCYISINGYSANYSQVVKTTGKELKVIDGFKFVTEGQESYDCIILNDDYIMLPFSTVTKNTGYTASYINERESFNIYRDSQPEYQFFLDSTYALKRDVQRIILDVSPIFYDGELFLSVDTIEKYLGIKNKVELDNNIVIVSPNPKPMYVKDFSFLFYDMDMTDIFAMVGLPDYYLKDSYSTAVYQLTNGKIYLDDVGSGKLKNIILQNSYNEQVTVGFTKERQYADFYTLPERFINDDPLINKNDFLLTRLDCVVYIMLSIGSPPYYQQPSYDYIPLICDGQNDILGVGAAEFWSEEYEKKCIFKEMVFLSEYAAKYAKISYGEYTCGLNNEYIYFNDFRFVTLEEAVAFMVRCLKPENINEKHLDETFDYAKKIGLISNKDYFANNPKHELSIGEFRTILGRFLEQPRGVYFNTEIKNYFLAYNFDVSGAKTYRQMLTNEYVELLMNFNDSAQFLE